jgi:hypothetical protein
VLLVPPLLTPKEVQERRRLQRLYDTAVRNNILLDIEDENRRNDAFFESIRREAIDLKVHYENQVRRHRALQHSPWELPSDTKSVKYLESRDWYNALASDTIVSPSVNRDFGTCRYGSDIRGVYFSRYNKSIASPGPEGKWYDDIFPGPKERTREVVDGVSGGSAARAFKPTIRLKKARGIEMTTRLMREKITARSAAHIEGVTEDAMRKRVERFKKELAATKFDFRRLSNKDLLKVMVDRGFYVVLPAVKKGLADELIPVKIDGLNELNATSAGLFVAGKEDEILGGLHMDMFREAVRKIRSTNRRKADQDRTIKSAQKRLAARFELAQVLYFGEPQPEELRETLRKRVRKALAGTSTLRAGLVAAS